MSKAALLAALNDRLRTSHSGGRVFITRGVADLPPATFTAIIEAVRSFDAFTPDNDPWGEHDCAVIEVQGQQIIRKIDYYDPTMTCGSDDPADPAKTCRVLTIMLADEY
jgi:Protein of unknown function (DUF3768)